MSHLQQRLKERNIKIDESILWNIAKDLNVDSAVIVARLDSSLDDKSGNYYTRNESNGDLVFLIVRNRKPITIMYRRSSQNNSASQLRVNQVLELLH